MLDIIIRNGTVIDGTGAPGFRADVAIQDGKIAAVGDMTGREARREAGLTVTPGFIDIHRHADAAAFRPGFGAAELCQGLTTIVNGNCGLSCAPFGGAHGQAIRDYLRPITGEIPAEMATGSLADYFASLPALPLHMGMLAGAGVLRADAAGYELEHLEDRHYRAIHRALEQALADGALGVSLGLGYAPECFYTTEELIRALQPIAGQDVPVTVHMRQEGGGVCQSVEEMLTVARALGVPMHISHLKAMGRENWGTKIPRALALMENARREGLDVSCDVYPYTAGSTQLLHILPPEFLEGGMDAVAERLADLRPADPGALPGDDDRLYGRGGGHCGHPPRPVQQPDLRRHLSHGGAAPPAGIRQLHKAAGTFCPGDGDTDVGAGRAQADGRAGGGPAAAGQGRAGPGGGRGRVRVRPGEAPRAGDVSAAPADGRGHDAGAGGRAGRRPGRTADRRDGRTGDTEMNIKKNRRWRFFFYTWLR